MPANWDSKVLIVDDEGEADMSVLVVGDQVLDLDSPPEIGDTIFWNGTAWEYSRYPLFPVATDTVTAQLLVVPDGDNTGGIMVKGPDATWGDAGAAAAGGSAGYGKGQVFSYHKHGAGTANDNLLFRIDNTGGIGTTGAVHVATGLRQDGGYAPTQAVWVQPSQNMAGVVVDSPPATYSASPLLVRDTPTSATMLEVLANNAGTTVKTALTVNPSASSQVSLGSISGNPGIGFGNAGDAAISRTAANTLSTNSTVIANDATANRVAIGNSFSVPCVAFGQTADTLLFRSAATVLATAANGVLKTGQNVTASRPSAATVGNGAQFYDTTLNKPIWSNGTVWRDAAGNTV